MVVRGELKCYHCGYVSALAKGEEERPLREWDLRLSPICDPQKAWRAGRLHCCRCGGPIYMDERDFLLPPNEESTPQEQ